PRRGRALLRHAEPHGGDRPGADHSPILVPAPARYPGVDAGPARAAAPERPAAHRLRGCLAGLLLPRGRAALGPCRSIRLRSGLVRSALYTGTVMHARKTPKENVFRYRVCFYLLDLDELPELDRRVRLFGWNRRNVVSLQARDHLDIRGYLAEQEIEADRILLLTNLRVLGYVFNPVSFFYCYRGDDLACIVAEVCNTFGERLQY